MLLKYYYLLRLKLDVKLWQRRKGKNGMNEKDEKLNEQSKSESGVIGKIGSTLNGKPELSGSTTGGRLPLDEALVPQGSDKTPERESSSISLVPEPDESSEEKDFEEKSSETPEKECSLSLSSPEIPGKTESDPTPFNSSGTNISTTGSGPPDTESDSLKGVVASLCQEMPLIYVAGPYRAATEWGIATNVSTAAAISLSLWKMGYSVICPHKNTNGWGGVPDSNGNPISDDLWLAGDLVQVSRCDAVFALPGCNKSEGATIELALAKEWNIPVITTIVDAVKFLKTYSERVNKE